MGSCLCKGHREIHLPMTVLQDQTEEGQLTSVKDGQSPSNGNVSNKSGHYDIGELATSSLIGLVATIKEHITKPTAMAQGRVAHLIEWKGWGGGGGEAGGHGGGGGGWGGMEEDEFYSQMTDEIKEARFAAGVAEQFALAEATMHVWSLNDIIEGPSTSLQAAQSHFLSEFLLDGGSMGIPQHLYNLHAQSCAPCRATANLFPVSTVHSVSPTLFTQQGKDQRPSEDRSTVTTEATVRHVDSSSLSEDDVFYN